MNDLPAAKLEEPQVKGALAVEVQFHPVDRVHRFSTDDATLARGEEVLAEVEGGTAIGRVVAPSHEAAEGELATDTKRVLRRATPEDIAAASELCEKAMECFDVCRDRIQWRGLPMKLVDAEIVDGGRKVIFTFFAEERVDFRALVKELAATLRLRIEMRQVGSRDESKLVGCLGPCGLTTCCSTHLRQFQSISISMAKHQGLAPNPAKLTGMCGKLKCCLSYEIAAYNECRQGLPKIGAAVETPKGSGKVAAHNVLKRECMVRLYGGGETRCPCEQCRPLTNEEREKAITALREAQEQAEERWRSRREKRAERGGGRQDRNAGRGERRPSGERPQAQQPPSEQLATERPQEQAASPSGEQPSGGPGEGAPAQGGGQPASGAEQQARGPSTTASGRSESPAGERKEGRHGRHRHRRSRKKR
jgi:cell fate regulator YaaT (PSP1 superfamily)